MNRLQLVVVLCLAGAVPPAAAPQAPVREQEKPAASRAQSQPPHLIPLGSAPDGLRPAADQAFAAFDRLQGSLMKRLMTEMQAGGPVAAIDVCRLEAQTITAGVAREQGIVMGRTSARLRNPANGAPAWARSMVAASDNRKADSAVPMVVDLEDRVGVVRPIGVATPCTRCHGDRQSFSPALTAALAKAYPQDQATGFHEGELRGFFWAEVPKSKQ